MNNSELVKIVISCLDLTSLDENDDESQVEALCRRAATPAGPVAAVCILPRFVQQARNTLDGMGCKEVAVATVANFPRGDQSFATVEKTIELAGGAGATELDVVLPYRALLAGNSHRVEEFLSRVRRIAASLCLKVILETGELKREETIHRASLAAIMAGADFIKTSTGKVPVNATPDAAAVMLKAIRKTGGGCGFKAAGGIGTVAAARRYVELAEKIMGTGWLKPDRFRIGASGLLDGLL